MVYVDPKTQVSDTQRPIGGSPFGGAGSTPAWFAESLGRPPKAPRKRYVYVVTSTCAVLIASLALAFYLLTKQQPTQDQCLQASDYKQLTGEDAPDDLNPVTDFYSAPFSFQANSLVFKDSNTTNVNESRQIESLGAFYASHKDKSLQIEIWSIATTDALVSELEKQRANMIRDNLVAAGVPIDYILTSNAGKLAGQVIDTAEARGDIDTLTLNITSSPDCR